jgi:hypothetical protein
MTEILGTGWSIPRLVLEPGYVSCRFNGRIFSNTFEALMLLAGVAVVGGQP